ncbi:iron(III) transport system substrate-binding protein [[Clostridium] aminophilum]|uniref:Iron(III) transport system substrate-binding protein n=1 Tax=[Clostridium] aminophilum TaxID=1526 RepID=A0A1I0C7S3_9FIRM|nr:hypothetical protein [[Clostridium] aminophilum]SET14992.1 iron(III) transport system substrate-binding protein [[Clostridium] aminophilum]
MNFKKFTALSLTAAMAASMAACGGSSSTATTTAAAQQPSESAAETTAAASAEKKDYSDYTIRIYSNSNSTERTTWLIKEAEDAGFKISIDDNSVISGDTAAVQAANEKKDGDIIFGLNETRWSQIIGGEYENLKLVDWAPSWKDKVGSYKFDNAAYGLVVQGSLLLYRTDDLGTNGKELKFDHWADMLDSGYSWYRQNKVGGTTNTNINNSLLFAYVDPSSPAGGISVDGWKMLWKYCADGKFSSDDTYKYGFDPLNKGDVAVSSFYTSSLYGKIDAAAENSDKPLKGTTKPENWALADVKDGVFYIAEYIGVLDKKDRTPEQTEAVKAFADWFGSADVQAAWGEEFDSFPCNEDAANTLYPDGIPALYTQPNMAQQTVDGMTYAEYAAKHNAEWTNIETNLGYFWADAAGAAKEPDWDKLDWATLTQKKGN